MIGQVTTDNHGTLNLLAQPNKSSAILAAIPYKTQPEAETINDEWSKVTYKNQSGYVMSKFLFTASSHKHHDDLQKIYDSLKSTLSLIESVLK